MNETVHPVIVWLIPWVLLLGLAAIVGFVAFAIGIAVVGPIEPVDPKVQPGDTGTLEDGAGI